MRSSDAGDTAPQHQTYRLPSKHIPREPRPKEKQEKEKTNHKDESGPSPDRLELLQLCKSRRRRAAWQLCLYFLTEIFLLRD